MDNLSRFGNNYEVKFLNQIIGTLVKKNDLIERDSRFGTEYINVIEANYFDYQYSKITVDIIKDYYKNYRKIPHYTTIDEQFRIKYNQFAKKYGDVDIKTYHAFLNEVQYALIEDIRPIRKQGGEFIKSRKLKEISLKVGKIADENIEGGYELAKKLLREEQAVFRDTETDVVVDENNIIELTQKRLGFIPTGIPIVDKDLNGGVRRQKPTLFFAGSNVGKTTISTVLFSNIYRAGYNVVYISGEDGINDLSLKTLSHWSGISINQISKNEKVAHRQFVESFGNVRKEHNNMFRLKHLTPAERNIDFVMGYLENLYYDEGVMIDLVVIDYLDTLIQGADKWKQQMDILFKMEAMAVTMNFASLIIHQGRANIGDKRKLTREDMRGDTALFDSLFLVLYATKDTSQKGTNFGNFGILKSKFGDADLFYENITIDNRFVRMEIKEESVFIKNQTIVNELLGVDIEKKNKKAVDDTVNALFKNIK